MKTLFSLLMMTLISVSAQAKISYGSECGLIDSADDFELTHLQTQKLKQISQLTNLQKKQLIHTTQEAENMAPREALAYLIESSEGGDLYYESGDFNGKSYQVIRFYPGGNPYGVVYSKDSTEPLAFISDSDLICAEKSN